MLKKIVMLSSIVLVVGCNSNPPPTNAKFYKEEALNESFFSSKKTAGVIKQNTKNSWEFKKIFNHSDDEFFKNPEYYYMTAHADHIVIYTDNYDTYRNLSMQMILDGSTAEITKKLALNSYSNAILFKKDGVK